ncbi:DUF433 domain-containing protein [Singulisphaera acidiphila]|uniref:DUF433 domain-containing protein n=1 Tax=Singulisphaera acidiphila TaxID=466153 RepID=UPI0009DA64E9
MNRVVILPGSASIILDFLASSVSIPDILKNYPDLEGTDILACIAYMCAASTQALHRNRGG